MTTASMTVGPAQSEMRWAGPTAAGQPAAFANFVV